jgi:outer membrane lipoprotein-sorting protein
MTGGMLRCLRLAGGLLPMLALPAAAVVCDSNESCLRLVQAQQQSTRSLSARIVQTKHLSLLDEPLVNRGSFAFRAPDQVLWKLDDPPLTVRIDAAGVHVPGRPDIEKEVAQTPFNRVMREFSGMFTGNLAAMGNAFGVQARGTDDQVVLSMVPQQETWKRMFQSIELRFAAPSYTIRSIRLSESLGDRLLIEFSDVHRNDAAADAALQSP